MKGLVHIRLSEMLHKFGLFEQHCGKAIGNGHPRDAKLQGLFGSRPGDSEAHGRGEKRYR
jgi:hypothetical protein